MSQQPSTYIPPSRSATAAALVEHWDGLLAVVARTIENKACTLNDKGGGRVVLQAHGEELRLANAAAKVFQKAAGSSSAKTPLSSGPTKLVIVGTAQDIATSSEGLRNLADQMLVLPCSQEQVQLLVAEWLRRAEDKFQHPRDALSGHSVRSL